jgi:hypothetical protein
MEIQTAENDLSVQNSILSPNSQLSKKTGQELGKPTSYSLSQNYPNPFNPVTTIKYEIPNDGLVTIKIYDIIGREVKTVENAYKSQGKYSVIFEASHFASGVYFYQLKSGNYTSTKKMLLLK